MNKFLSIIVPRYKESERDIFPLLSSINNQVGIDFFDIEVIIANDGGGVGPLSDEFLEWYNMEICQIDMPENRGPGVARQVGFDVAKGKYVMFCDADDILHNVAALGALIQECKNKTPDMLTSEWLEEKIEDSQFAYITHEIDNTWMFGKVFRRAFLIENKIRFHDTLRVHEDSYFLFICASLAEKNYHMNFTTYVWRYTANSITRINDCVYSFKSIPIFIKAISLALEKVEAITPDQIECKVVQFVLYIYFLLHLQNWLEDENKHYLIAAENAFSNYFKHWRHYWDKADSNMITQIYNEERQRTFINAVETELIGDWIIRLDKKEA